jgi:NAD-specific glutamate dehydrogenase
LGISEVMRRESDQLFYVPMKGMTKSYNVSSFSAVLLSTLEAHKEQVGYYLQPLEELEKVSKNVRKTETETDEEDEEETRRSSNSSSSLSRKHFFFVGFFSILHQHFEQFVRNLKVLKGYSTTSLSWKSNPNC